MSYAVPASHPMAASVSYAAAPQVAYASAPRVMAPAVNPLAYAMPQYATAQPMPQYASAMSAPAVAGPLVDPQSIQRQKEEHAKGLESQLKNGAETLGQAHKNQIAMLHAAATQQKQQYLLHMDQKVKEQELMLGQQYNQALMQLQQAAQAQRAELEIQAAKLTLAYQQSQTSDQFAVHKAQLEKQSYEHQARLHAEMAQLGPVPAPFAAPAAYAAPMTYAAPPTSMQGGGSYVPPGYASGPPNRASYVPPTDGSVQTFRR